MIQNGWQSATLSRIIQKSTKSWLSWQTMTKKLLCQRLDSHHGRLKQVWSDFFAWTLQNRGSIVAVPWGKWYRGCFVDKKTLKTRTYWTVLVMLIYDICWCDFFDLWYVCCEWQIIVIHLFCDIASECYIIVHFFWTILAESCWIYTYEAPAPYLQKANRLVWQSMLMAMLVLWMLHQAKKHHWAQIGGQLIDGQSTIYIIYMYRYKYHILVDSWWPKLSDQF